MRSEGDNFKKDVIVGAVLGSRSRGRPRRHWALGTKCRRLAEDDYQQCCQTNWIKKHPEEGSPLSHLPVDNR